MKKNCTLLLPRPVFPVVSGYSHKNYNLIQILSGQYKLHIVVISQDVLADEEIAFYHTCGAECTVHRMAKGKSYIQTILGLLSSRPLQVSYYYDSALQPVVNSLAAESDVIIAALVRTREYVERAVEVLEKKEPHVEQGKPVVVFDMVDSIALNYGRSRSKTKSLFWKLIYSIEGSRLMKYEQHSIERSSITYLFNQEEQTYWKRYGNVQWLPHGVEAKLLTYAKREEAWSGQVAFIGKMNYQPNVDAILWYMKHVHVHIGHRVPLIIVGAYPTKEIEELAASLGHVTVTGFVDDPYIYINSAMAVIAPMQTGGGIQNKVLEGMALGKVNIVSSLAAGPIIGAVDGKHLLVADRPEDMERLILELAEDQHRYDEIGKHAKELIEKTFSWVAYGEGYVSGIEKDMREI
ncbi:MAG: glycosyltransferase family 4 protein [Lachnospiraceae bacterium]|nr:glycosyltransferase family 4 protein [Lachnospiraceae bacterium]